MTLADLAWAVEDVRKRLPGYALFRAYDEGQHRLTFATEKYRNTFGDLFREFADNMCDDVVDGIVDRLQVIAWTAADTKTNQAADDVWTRNRGPARTGAIMRNAFREGDGFALVQTDKAGKARIWKQRPEQMAVRYSTDNPDLIDVAAKVWKDGKRYRANLYYPDGLTEKYASRGLGNEGGLPQVKAFTPLQPGDPGLGADETFQVEGDYEGSPVFHFPNGEVSEYGRSAIEKVIPLQDALNKSVADMLVAMEFHAYPQRWATGVQVERDENGQERSPFAAGEGRVWRTGSKDAEFGQFPAAEMTGFLEVQDGFRLEIARKGALPPHSINLRGGSSAAPSGVSLLVAEGKTIKMARDRQRDWGHTKREMMAYALNLEGHSGVTAADLDCEWAPPETRDEKALVETLLLKRDLKVSDRQLLLEAGYDSDQVDDFLDAVEAQGEAEDLARQTLTGGRRTVTVGSALALPAGPVPPDGGQSALAS